MTYTANKTGYWVVALKVEDFEFSADTKPLSGTSIQFLVIVIAKTDKCTKGRKCFVVDRNVSVVLCEAPFYYGVKPRNTCTSIDVGTTVNDIAQFSLACEYGNLTEVEMYKPESKSR